MSQEPRAQATRRCSPARRRRCFRHAAEPAVGPPSHLAGMPSARVIFLGIDIPSGHRAGAVAGVDLPHRRVGAAAGRQRSTCLQVPLLDSQPHHVQFWLETVLDVFDASSRTAGAAHCDPPVLAASASTGPSYLRGASMRNCMPPGRAGCCWTAAAQAAAARAGPPRIS